ncbi:MAG: sulfatase-like hydrolase/transferase, partial [Candidatus Altiarchaeota archaeon]|nr:sulfatase-like hydrolase/transferase [Candidatus Altiarchaeota archaeon]
GVYPSEHGLVTPQFSLDKGQQTLAEILEKRNYSNQYYYHAWFPLSDYGFGRGFMERGKGNTAFVFGKNAIDFIKSVKENDTNARFFIWQHHIEPHLPYNPKGDYASLYIEDIPNEYKGTSRRICMDNEYSEEEIEYFKALHDGEIRYTDEAIGDFIDELKAIGEYNNTIIVILGDHGEEFWEHGGCDHGQSVYDEQIHVPLFMRVPTLKDSKVISKQVSEIDILPTILDILNISINSRSGRSFMPVILGYEKTERPVYSETKRLKKPGIKTSVRYKGHKLIRTIDKKYLNETWELYDMIRDPKEENNIWGPNSEIVNELEEIMEKIDDKIENNRSGTGEIDEIELSKNAEKRLRDFGYLD